MKHYILIDEYGSLLIDFNQNKEVAEHWQKLFDGSRIEYTDEAKVFHSFGGVWEHIKLK